MAWAGPIGRRVVCWASGRISGGGGDHTRSTDKYCFRHIVASRPRLLFAFLCGQVYGSSFVAAYLISILGEGRRFIE